MRRLFSKIALRREKAMLGKGKRVHYRLSKMFKRIGVEGNCWLLMGVKEALRALGLVEEVNLTVFLLCHLYTPYGFLCLSKTFCIMLFNSIDAVLA